MLYVPPLFRVSPEPGAFRVQSYEKPASEVLTGSAASATPVFARGPEAPQDAATQALVDRYRARAGPGRSSGSVPVNVSFPSVGPSMFLVAELTGEGKGEV